MIHLICDEAFAIDYLAILIVKRSKGLPVADHLEQVQTDLERQITQFGKIMRSDEFAALIDTNALTFEAIDLAHRDEIKASTVQEINGRRYLAKRALQERFWPKSILAEVKTGLTTSR